MLIKATKYAVVNRYWLSRSVIIAIEGKVMSYMHTWFTSQKDFWLDHSQLKLNI